MPTTVTRYRCDVCGSLYDAELAATNCEAVPVTGDQFRVGDKLVRGNDVFEIVDRHIRRMGKANGENLHLALFAIAGPYTWSGKPRLTSAKYLRRLGLRPLAA